jgi:hypothetical protein
LIAIKLSPSLRLARRKQGTLKKARRPNKKGQLEAARMSSSERTIIELNIRRYQRLLTVEADPGKRQTIATLLAEEEAKLANFDKKRTSGGPQ